MPTQAFARATLRIQLRMLPHTANRELELMPVIVVAGSCVMVEAVAN